GYPASGYLVPDIAPGHLAPGYFTGWPVSGTVPGGQRSGWAVLDPGGVPHSDVLGAGGSEAWSFPPLRMPGPVTEPYPHWPGFIPAAGMVTGPYGDPPVFAEAGEWAGTAVAAGHSPESVELSVDFEAGATPPGGSGGAAGAECEASSAPGSYQSEAGRLEGEDRVPPVSGGPGVVVEAGTGRGSGEAPELVDPLADLLAMNEQDFQDLRNALCGEEFPLGGGSLGEPDPTDRAAQALPSSSAHPPLVSGRAPGRRDARAHEDELFLACHGEHLRNALESGRGEIALPRRLADVLRRRIADGSLPPGTRLPWGRRLAEYLGTSRSTVQTAYGRLVKEGLLDGGKGVGTWVKSGQVVDAAAVLRAAPLPGLEGLREEVESGSKK